MINFKKGNHMDTGKNIMEEGKAGTESLSSTVDVPCQGVLWPSTDGP